MSMHMRIEPFNPNSDDWPEYVEWPGQYFEANDLTGDGKAVKRRSTLITLMSPSTYKLARSLLSPAKQSESSSFDKTL